MIQLEDTLAQVRKEYEMLRIEFEQTLAANEQAGTAVLSPPCRLCAVNAVLERHIVFLQVVNTNLTQKC